MQIKRYRFDGEDIIDKEKLPEHDLESLAALLMLLTMTGMTDDEIIDVLVYSFKISRVKAKALLLRCRPIWEAIYVPKNVKDEEYKGPSLF